MKARKNINSKRTTVADRWFKRDCFPTVMNSLITAIIAAVVAFVVDIVNPRARMAEKKDELFIELAERLTGKVDTETVERVKKDLIDHLENAMRNYPTKEEFARDKNRHVDKKLGVVWEERMEDGHMFLVPVSAYTNENERSVR